MNLSCGIVGLPNVGKSTLFNALLKKQVASAANYPFTTIEPNVGVVEVPDARLKALADTVEKSEGLSPAFRIVPAVVQFVDIAGLVKGAHKGEGLGNQFLSHIRDVDLIVFVVRDFKSEEVIRADSEEPQKDLEVLKAELLLKDLESIERRIDSLGRELKASGPSDPRRKELEVLSRAKELAGEGKWLAQDLSGEELETIKSSQLLSAKKYLVVLNSDEEDLGKETKNIEATEVIEGSIKISAKLEEELASFSPGEQKEYLANLGLSEGGLGQLCAKAYGELDLISYFTAGSKEVRAWTIELGALAPQAAGVIHSDFERGFIAADVINWQDFVAVGGWKAARVGGKVKTIGKSDQVLEGQVVEFKFSI